MKVVLLTKRSYSKHDLISDRFGRLFHFPVQLASRGTEIRVWAADYHTHLTEVVRIEGVDFSSFSSNYKGLEFLYGAQFNAIRDFNPDVIIASGHTHLMLIGKLVARRIGCLFVAECYDYYPEFHQGGFPGDAWVFQKVIDSAAGVIFASAASEVDFAGKTPSIVIPNGVAEHCFRPMDRTTCRREFGFIEDDLVISLTGSLELERGLGCLLDALRIVVKGHPRIRLALAGRPDFSTCELPFPVTYFGQLEQERLARLINASDVATAIYAKNSLNDYINSCKLVESISCGVPVVASSVGDCSFTVGKDFPGLCPPDDPEALALAIGRQLSNPVLAILKSSYSWKSLGHQLESFLVSMVTSR